MEFPGKLPSLRSDEPVYSDKKDFVNEVEYERARNRLLLHEAAQRMDVEARKDQRGEHRRAGTSKRELKAADILRQVLEHDQAHIYGPSRHSNGTQRYAGGPFLENLDLINQTRAFQIARRMPKAALLHAHYNAILPARFLIEQARDIKHMWIRSTLPLISDANMLNTEIQVLVQPRPSADERGDLFDPNYQRFHWMRYMRFLRLFPGGQPASENWLVSKLEFREEQTHGPRVTVRRYVLSTHK